MWEVRDRSGWKTACGEFQVCVLTGKLCCCTSIVLTVLLLLFLVFSFCIVYNLTKTLVKSSLNSWMTWTLHGLEVNPLPLYQCYAAQSKPEDAWLCCLYTRQHAAVWACVVLPPSRHSPAHSGSAVHSQRSFGVGEWVGGWLGEGRSSVHSVVGSTSADRV